MAYSTDSPPQLLGGFTAFTNAPQIWTYTTADATADVDTDGYITNGDHLGMKAGDFVLVNHTAQGTIGSHRVEAVTSGGAANLADATVIGSTTDTD